MTQKDLAQFLKLLRKNGVVRFSDGAVSVEFGGPAGPARSRGTVDIDPLEEEPKDPIAVVDEDPGIDSDGVPNAMRPVT